MARCDDACMLGALSDAATLTPIQYIDNVILVGANGCDVCGESPPG